MNAGTVLGVKLIVVRTKTLCFAAQGREFVTAKTIVLLAFTLKEKSALFVTSHAAYAAALPITALTVPQAILKKAARALLTVAVDTTLMPRARNVIRTVEAAKGSQITAHRVKSPGSRKAQNV